MKIEMLNVSIYLGPFCCFFQPLWSLVLLLANFATVYLLKYLSYNIIRVFILSISRLTLFAVQQEGYLACKKIPWCSVFLSRVMIIIIVTRGGAPYKPLQPMQPL